MTALCPPHIHWIETWQKRNCSRIVDFGNCWLVVVFSVAGGGGGCCWFCVKSLRRRQDPPKSPHFIRFCRWLCRWVSRRELSRFMRALLKERENWGLFDAVSMSLSCHINIFVPFIVILLWFCCEIWSNTDTVIKYLHQVRWDLFVDF